jgi:predicted membrane metal-binding protein
MKINTNEVLQWTGAVFIIAMHVLNAVGPSAYPYNIITATLGTICFMAWSYRVANKPQLLVNVVAMTLCVLGLYRALG